MKVEWTEEQLAAFEDEVAAAFLVRKIRAPIHLSGGNERQLIALFRERVEPADWVLTTWRSHWHSLLKGVPREEVMRAIMEGRSISLCFPAQRVLSSAIVGGIAPLAVGLAAGIKATGAKRKVVCFLGDMAAESGLVHEAIKYAAQHALPVLWVVEDNGQSAGADTRAAWGGVPTVLGLSEEQLVRYEYQMTRPHVGVGQHVSF